MSSLARSVTVWTLGMGLVALVPTVEARRLSCELRCGHEIAKCVLDRGGVDGQEIPACHRKLVTACRQHGRRACPLPSREELAVTLAAVQAAEATVHENPLCAALVPPLPVDTIEQAIAIGRDAAATLAGTTDPNFQAQGQPYRGGVFGKLFI